MQHRWNSMGKQRVQKSHWHKAFISSLKTSIIVFTQDIFHTVTLPLLDGWLDIFRTMFQSHHFFTTMVRQNVAPVASKIVHSNREHRRKNQLGYKTLIICCQLACPRKKFRENPWTMTCKLNQSRFPELDVVSLYTRTPPSDKLRKDKNGGWKSAFIYTHAGQSIRLMHPSVRLRLSRCEFG